MKRIPTSLMPFSDCLMLLGISVVPLLALEGVFEENHLENLYPAKPLYLALASSSFASCILWII